MSDRERRSCRRYRLYYPIYLHTIGQPPHLAEIVDAGRKGVRIRLTNHYQLSLDQEIILQGAIHSNLQNLCCRVAWQNPEHLEVGVVYI